MLFANKIILICFLYESQRINIKTTFTLDDFQHGWGSGVVLVVKLTHHVCSYSLEPASAGGPPPPLLPPSFSDTCARDRRTLQQLALNVHVKHSDLTRPINSYDLIFDSVCVLDTMVFKR